MSGERIGGPSADDRGRDSEVSGLKVPALGEFVDDKYRVEANLGTGGQGVVLRARDEQLARDVAIKLVKPELVSDRHTRNQFLREARAMARVRHPNVAEIYAFGERHGAPYFVMEFVPGIDLFHWLREGNRRPIPIDDAINIVEQVCRGVVAMHAGGAIHHDLKPSNILIGPAFRCVITDLGLSRIVAGTNSSGKRFLGGTPGYLAPEVAACIDTPTELAPRSDVYSLGVIAYELLVGKPPFKHEDADELIKMHLELEVTRPSERRTEIPASFDEPILRALAKDPAQRTPDAATFRRELLGVRGDVPSPRRSTTEILVADDDVDFHRWVEAVIEDGLPGVRIRPCLDGTAALGEIMKKRPDLIICDLDMPGLNGVELTAAVQNIPDARNVPILVTTAVGGAPDWQLLQSIGAKGFLLKPFDPASLMSLIRRLLTIEREASGSFATGAP
jgi:serine/threonine-protein kinase